ncbi:MAG: hypothetical protein GY754_12800 [bacterium]|nr:hypothetical protein [bacterium]
MEVNQLSLIADSSGAQLADLVKNENFDIDKIDMPSLENFKDRIKVLSMIPL